MSPGDDRERQIETKALRLVDAMSDARWLLIETTSSAVPTGFLIMLIFWMALLFACFGLFAPKNATVVACMFLCVLAISGGILMILELGSPGRGLIQVPIDPMFEAISQLQPSR
jgi:hypothetical protein